MDGPGATRGVFTFLLTDLVGSTALWERDPDGMGVALANHFALVTGLIEQHGGTAFKNTGDGLAAVFTVPVDAVAAARAVQVAVRQRSSVDGGLPVRVGVNTGDAEARAGDYFGGSVNLAARVMSAAHAGQVLVGESTVMLSRFVLSDEMSFIDLGEHWLKGFTQPQRLFQLLHPDLLAEFPRPGAGAHGGTAPPRTLSSFVGRRHELATLRRLLDEHRLVTIVGPAGVGKTRLAGEAATAAAEVFDDGVWWCDLASVVDAREVAHAVASAVDVTVGGDRAVDAVVANLATRGRLLVVIDNCEHQVEAVRSLVSAVLERCAGVTVLATSREAMRLPGERVQLVEPLEASAADDSPAVRLFYERARAAGARCDDDPATVDRIGRLCARLDGLPLAIELAAARTRSMTIDELDAGLEQRFTVLTRRARAGTEAERHETLERAVGWSYGLLDAEERVLFEALSVFRGFGLDAARDVAASVGLAGSDVPDLLFELVEKSIVRTDTSGSTTRFALLETIRDFGAARLAERGLDGEVARAHRRWFLDLAERAERGRGGRDERMWVEIQLREFDNLRAAMASAVANDDADTAIPLYVALYELASFQGRVEVFDWLPVDKIREYDHQLAPAALAMSGLRHDPLRPVSNELAVEAVRRFEERGGRNHRMLSFARGYASASRGRRSDALDDYARAADVILETEGPNGRWITARSLVVTAMRDADAGRALVREAHEIGQPSGIAFALLALARAIERDRPDSALSLTEEAEAHATTALNHHAQFYVDLTAASIVAESAGTGAALGYLLRALDRALQLRQHDAMARALARLVAVLRRAGATDQADELAAAWAPAFPGTDLARSLTADRSTNVVSGAAGRSLEDLVELTRGLVERGLVGGVVGEPLPSSGRVDLP